MSTGTDQQRMKRQQSHRIVYFFVEGSIGAGKSTLLERVRSRLLWRGLPGPLVVVPEPIDAWRDVDGHNVLEAFYNDPKRWALAFQTHAMSTRVAAVRAAIEEASADGVHATIVLCERSVYTDRHVFVELLHRDGTLSDFERALYIRAYDYYISHAYPGKHGGVIYLRTDPRACAERIRRRDRTEESAIPLKYLERLHSMHQEALAAPDAWGGAALLNIDVEQLGSLPDDDAVADALADRIHAFITDIVQE